MRPTLEPSAQAGGRQATWLRKHVRAVTCVAVIISAAAIVCAVILVAVVKLRGPSDPAPSTPGSGPIRYLGVYEPNAPGSYVGVEQFAHTVGRQPNLVSYYSGWGEEFQKEFAETAESHGATTLVQIDPTNISLSNIAAGIYDPYLASFADSVAAFKHEVIISFGHEMNGYWYSWGYRHTPASTFIAAWRHIVTLFRQHGADNVKWLWQVNSLSPKTGPPREWWPGAQYVTWVGISGYYFVPGDTFYNLFDPVVYAVKQFTQDPILIAETGVGPQAGQTRGIDDLFAGVRMQHDIGLVWFDRHSYGGIYKGEDWRLEGNRIAIAAFRDALKG
jgi:mannan endo-1,4-beta-mannosidase